MNAADYIEHRIRTCGVTHDAPPEFISESVRAAYIEQLVFRKPYRKWKVGDVLKERVPHAIEYTLSHKQPLTFRYWFGG